MKAILEFNLPEDKMEHQRAVRSTDAFLALWDISQNVFRPARKHGYSDNGRLNYLLGFGEKNDQIMVPSNEVQALIEETISLLEQRFYEIVKEHGVNPYDNLE